MQENQYLKQLVISLIEHFKLIDDSDKVLNFSLESYEEDIEVTNGVLYLNSKNVGHVYPDSVVVLSKKGGKKLKKYLSNACVGTYPKFKILN
jgi:hypothetical protein